MLLALVCPCLQENMQINLLCKIIVLYFLQNILCQNDSFVKHVLYSFGPQWYICLDHFHHAESHPKIYDVFLQSHHNKYESVDELESQKSPIGLKKFKSRFWGQGKMVIKIQKHMQLLSVELT